MSIDSRIKPIHSDELFGGYHRCSACDTVLETATRPRGGKFEPITDELTVNGETVHMASPAEGGQGCWFCGSPEHASGGDLGDMKNPFSRGEP